MAEDEKLREYWESQKRSDERSANILFGDGEVTLDLTDVDTGVFYIEESSEVNWYMIRGRINLKKDGNAKK